jgi:hypothetical protein
MDMDITQGMVTGEADTAAPVMGMGGVDTRAMAEATAVDITEEAVSLVGTEAGVIVRKLVQ